jgi:hypothetical protein
MSQWTAASVQRLREVDWIEGHTLAIERAEKAAPSATSATRSDIDCRQTRPKREETP